MRINIRTPPHYATSVRDWHLYRSMKLYFGLDGLGFGTTDSQNVRHSHELGERACSHLLHDIAAMHLHGDFADPHFAGDLLIQETGGYVRHHFVFTGRQRFEISSKLRNRLFPSPPSAVPLERQLNGVQQILLPHWLGEELYCPSLHGSDRHRNITVPGDENDRNLNTVLGQLGLKIESAELRQSDIQHEAAGHIRMPPL